MIAEFSGSPDLKEGRPALTPGMFATAEIIGRPVGNVIELSNAALSPDGHVLVVNDESKLERRDVSVVSREGRSVWVSGLREGVVGVAELNNALLPGLQVLTDTALNYYDWAYLLVHQEPYCRQFADGAAHYWGL